MKAQDSKDRKKQDKTDDGITGYYKKPGSTCCKILQLINKQTREF